MTLDWTSEVVGRMHNAGITGKMLAHEAGYTRPYLSQVLHSRKTTEESRARVCEALERLELRASNGEMRW